MTAIKAGGERGALAALIPLLAFFASACGTQGTPPSVEGRAPAEAGNDLDLGPVLVIPDEGCLGPGRTEGMATVLGVKDAGIGIDLVRLFTGSPQYHAKDRRGACPVLPPTEEDLTYGLVLELDRLIGKHPKSPELYEIRSRLWEDLGWPARARQDRFRSRLLRKGRLQDLVPLPESMRESGNGRIEP